MKYLAMLLGVLGALLGHAARSDEIRPGYLELRQTAPDTYDLLFKIPALGDDYRLAIYVNLPEGTNDVMPPRAATPIANAVRSGEPAASPDRPS
jgi:hypothetical protein